MNTQELLKERGSTHGPFSENARIAQQLKDVMATSLNWNQLPPVQKEAIHMILHKLARIGSGDFLHADNYVDIAGYATLAIPPINDVG